MAGARCKHTIEEHVFLLTHFYQQNAKYETIFSEFQKKFSNSLTATRQNVHKMYTKFQQRGTVADASHLV